MAQQIQVKLAPPIIDSKIAAQPEKQGDQTIIIPFLMNRAVGWSQFQSVKILIKTVQSSTDIGSAECIKDALIFKDGKYWATFKTGDIFTPGQSYKVQLAYTSIEDKYVGHFSTIGTFKFTTKPEVYIKELNDSEINTHIYNYTGVYENKDQSERVYSYRFDLYNELGEQVATSGDQLHNSSKDTEITSSTDTWSTRYTLEDNKIYTIVYNVMTVNGLHCTSKTYQIYNGVTFNSSMSKYCNLIADVNNDEAYVELSIQHNQNNKENKYINGQFLLLRSSSEDNFSSWHEITKFVLSAHNVFYKKFICRDYCVAQGVVYKYAIQAYNDKGVYANRQIAKPAEVCVDFEDMFLSDGERQLKIRFNPKVTSFKNTLLESKMDTLGGKYPFFFRNGNTSYKEFPISGLISMLMDTEGSFLEGITFANNTRTKTPADKNEKIPFSLTNLTGDIVYKEREFKMEVLHWLINGKPKMFRSPVEGNYIIRLMNTSLSPNDTLGRMLHTFSSTAYEIDDFNFDNLRKYNLMVDDYIETRELEFNSVKLGQESKYEGRLNNLNASYARIETDPGIIFTYLLKNDGEWNQMIIGPSGIFEFDSSVLADNELLAIGPRLGIQGNSQYYWPKDTVFTYASYKKASLSEFTQVDQVIINDRVSQHNGYNNSLLARLSDANQIVKTVGEIYYIRVGARPIIPIDKAVLATSDQYTFIRNNITYRPTPEVILRYDEGEGITRYFDGDTHKEIFDIDFRFKLNSLSDYIDMSGISFEDVENPKSLQNQLHLTNLSNKIRNTDSGVILTNITQEDLVGDIDDKLYIGNGLYVDIAYQEILKIYTVEVTEGTEINNLKKLLQDDKISYEDYYEALVNWYNSVGEEKIIDAI